MYFSLLRFLIALKVNCLDLQRIKGIAVPLNRQIRLVLRSAAVSALCIWGAAKAGAQDFRVQLATYVDSVPPSFFHERGIKEVIATYDRIGLYRYFYAGSFYTREEAEKVWIAVQQKGFPFATILDLAEQRILSGANCPYFRDGIIFMKDTSRENTVRNIYFELGSAVLNAAAKKELDLVAYWLKGNTKLQLGILGYTDAVGDATANAELGLNRARAARNYITSKGVRADRMFIRVYGEAQPLIPNSDYDGNDLPENRRWNRRVALALLEANGVVKTDAQIQEVIRSSEY